MHAIRQGQIRWIGKGDAGAQRQFIYTIFGIAASLSARGKNQRDSPP